jgi:hypothetical protein
LGALALERFWFVDGLYATSWGAAISSRSARFGTLSRFNGTTHGGLRTNGLIRSRELEIAIPRAASGAQQTVINNMIAYARGLNPPVTIRIVVYP